MRKTSHDGADSSSISSGKDNEIKKSATTFNKMTKSSIKRRVQNFSHESDDGIIEPLLQTEKDKIEIANRSAKYLLNKSKTESLHEKDTKVTDGYADKCSVPVPVSSNSIMITNNVKEIPVSTSYNCGSAPIHNHMNTNIFSTYEASTGLITTKNQILVEIDNSKPGKCSPSPLIFTTAKIHTDSKTKLMEPLQVTPVPILSTIEGNVVKAGIVSPPEASNLNKTSSDDMKTKKPEINVSQTYKDKTNSPTVAYPFLKSEALNENVKKPTTTSSANLLNQDIALAQLSNTVTLSAAAKLAINENMSLKEKSSNDTLPEIKSMDKYISAASIKNKSDKYSLIDRSKESFHILDNNIVPAPLDVGTQEKTHTVNLKSPELRKTHFISNDTEHPINIPITSNKKLQCQSIASIDATKDSLSKIGKTDTKSLTKEVDENSIAKNDKVLKVQNTSDFATRVILPVSTKVSSMPKSCVEHPPKSIMTPCMTSSSSTEVKTTNNVAAAIPKIESITETVNSKPTVSDVCKDIPKSISKSSAATSHAVDKHSDGSSKTSSMSASTAPLSSSKLATISVGGKPDVLSSLSCPPEFVETDLSIKCAVTTVNTTLPSYIVSTSKTKIGSTLTSNTTTNTSKSQVQKSFNIVNTTSGYCVKSFAIPGTKTSPSTSDSNGTKHMNFSKQTKSKAETIKKDGRA